MWNSNSMTTGFNSSKSYCFGVRTYCCSVGMGVAFGRFFGDRYFSNWNYGSMSFMMDSGYGRFIFADELGESYD